MRRAPARSTGTAQREPNTGRPRPLLAAAYPLPDLARAQADFVAKRGTGKLVIAVTA